jgi:hypothetical protein
MDRTAAFLTRVEREAPQLLDDALALLVREKKNAARDARIRALRQTDRYQQLSDYAAAEQMRKDFDCYLTTRWPRERGAWPGPVVDPAKTFWWVLNACDAGGPPFLTRQLLRIIAD